MASASIWDTTQPNIATLNQRGSLSVGRSPTVRERNTRVGNIKTSPRAVWAGQLASRNKGGQELHDGMRHDGFGVGHVGNRTSPTRGS